MQSNATGVGAVGVGATGVGATGTGVGVGAAGQLTGAFCGVVVEQLKLVPPKPVIRA